MVTVEGTADSATLVKFGSTLAIFYRKLVGSVNQVLLRTSTDDGKSWSSSTQLTTETVNVYRIQASNVGGTVYVFWSLSDTSGLLQYITSTDLANWSSKASVGQAIGPLQSQTYPMFDIKQLASGAWGLVWLYKSNNNEMGVGNSFGYPTVWDASSTSLGSTSWSNKQELTTPWGMRWPSGLSLAETGAGTVYASYTRYVYPWDYYVYYRTSTDSGASWAGATLYGYEPFRATNGWSNVRGYNSYLVVDGNGNIRSFWDQVATGNYGYTTALFERDLPSGVITPLPVGADVRAK